MRKILLETGFSNSEIFCGTGAFEARAKGYACGQVCVITDTNVNALYGELIKNTFPECFLTVIPAGEESKNPKMLLKILSDMLKRGMHRNCTVIAFGGGVVGDIAGLAASLYMRGVSLVQIPTTLLSQVDSSVGGKTAVDLNGVKNVIGTFYQPKEVIVDPLFLKTLPPREINCGLGEIVKYGALDGAIYKKLNENINNLRDYGFLEEITYDCILYKADIVKRDERDDKGLRKALNLGHTTGHAFELNYGGRSHGEFVLIGMYYELYIAVKRGICGGQYAEALKNLIYEVLGAMPCYPNISDAAKAAVHDKKNDDADIALILPVSEGEWTELKLGLKEYTRYLKECASEFRGLL